MAMFMENMTRGPIHDEGNNLNTSPHQTIAQQTTKTHKCLLEAADIKHNRGYK